MASVRKRKWTHKGVESEAWIVSYLDAKGNRRQKTFDKKKDADKYRFSVESEVANGLHTPSRDTVSFLVASESYLRDCERRHKHNERMTGNTIRSYRTAVTKVQERFGKTKISDLDREVVQNWLYEIAPNYSKKTIQKFNLMISMTLAHAVRNKWVARNILKDDPPKIPGIVSVRTRIPTRDEVVALLRLASNATMNSLKARRELTRSTTILLGVLAGLRRGEIGGLLWEDVDFERNIIKVRHSLSREDGLKEPKTRAGIRDVPMAPLLKESLRRLNDYWRLRREIFDESKPGDTVNAVNGRLKRRIRQGRLANPATPAIEGHVVRTTCAEHGQRVLGRDWGYGRQVRIDQLGGPDWFFLMKAAGLMANGKPRFTMHALRHAAASLFIESGLPAFNLKTVIGHSSVKVTYDVYGHLFPDDQRVETAVNDIASALCAAMERQDELTV